MDCVFIKNIAKHTNQSVRLRGWVSNFRSSGSIYFLQLRDGSGFIQCVASQKDMTEKVWKDLQKLTLESSVEVTGKVVEHPKKLGMFEVQAVDLKIYQIAEEYPISKKEHGPDFLLDHRHLWLRSKKQWAIQRVRNTVIYAIYDWMRDNGFIKIDSPILTPSACEGTTTLFEVPYFDWGKAYLSQTGQLYLEAAIAAHGRVFDFGPTFRAEKSKTRRHLTEFWMMDAEMAFCDHEENMKTQERLVSHIIQQTFEKNQSELEILERDVEPLKKIAPPFYRLTHAEAVDKINELGGKAVKGEDLGGDDETILGKAYDKPIFIEKYPAKVKSFYMKRDPEDRERVLCDDMIAPEGYGELIGGSQREDNYDELAKRIEEHKLPREDFEWYLDLRKYGSAPHAGFGIGLERTVGWICGVEHVRETIPFPRLIYRLRP